MADPINHDEFMARAADEAAHCVSESGKNSPKVGAVVVKDGKFLGSAYRGERIEGYDGGEGDHAEFLLLQKKLPKEDLTGAIVYTTLEPCTVRNHPKQPCAKWLAERRIGEVVIGLLDPDPRIYGNGMKALRDAGIKITHFPEPLRERLKLIDASFRGKFSANPDTSGTAIFNYMWNNGIFTVGHGQNVFDTKWRKHSADTIVLGNDVPTIQSIGLAIHCSSFDEVTDPGVFDMSSSTIHVKEGEIAVLKSKNNKYALVKVVDVKYKGIDERDEISIEYNILGADPVEAPPSPTAEIKSPAIVLPSESTTCPPPPEHYPYKAFLDYVGVPLEDEPIHESVKSVEKLNSILSDMPSAVRHVLAEIIKRSVVRRHSRHPMAAIVREIELALNVDPRELREYIAILDRLKLATVDEDPEDGMWKIFLRWWPVDWNIWGDLRGFCEREDVSLQKLIGEHRFDLLT